MRFANSATVGFVVSHACPLRCDFCCSDRSSVGPGRIGRDAITEILVGFAAEPSVRDFAFSGGDPFLYHEDIVAAVGAAREAGVRQPFHVVTSGYWAGRGRTRALLRDLRGVGMSRIVLSYDHEHARWVSPGQIREICDAAMLLGLEVEIWGTFWDEDEDVRDLLPDLDPAIRIVSHLALRAGRGAGSGKRARHSLPEDSKYSCGRPGHYSVAIYPDGEAFPCCSGDFNRSGGLSCGNVNRQSPGEILEAAFANFHVRTVKELGWGALYALVRSRFPELAPRLPSFGEADSACDICRPLNLELKAELAPVYALIEAEYACTTAEFEWMRQEREGAGSALRKFDGRTVRLDELKRSLREDAGLRRRWITGRATMAAP